MKTVPLLQEFIAGTLNIPQIQAPAVRKYYLSPKELHKKINRSQSCLTAMGPRNIPTLVFDATATSS
jgi:hypothetical protein